MDTDKNHSGIGGYHHKTFHSFIVSLISLSRFHTFRLSKSILRSLYSMILPAPLRFKITSTFFNKTFGETGLVTYSWHPASYPSNISSSSSFAVRKMTGIDLYFKSFLQKSIPEVPGSPISAIMTSGFLSRHRSASVALYACSTVYPALQKIFLALHSFEHRLRLIEFSSCTPFNLILPIIPHPQTTCQSVTATQFIIILSALLRSPGMFWYTKKRRNVNLSTFLLILTRGADRIWTGESGCCRPTPYHLATAPEYEHLATVL